MIQHEAWMLSFSATEDASMQDVCADLLLDEGAGGCVSDFCVAEFSSVDEFHQVLRRAKNHSANWQDLGSSFAPLPTTVRLYDV
jgi:hypothetical protein